jgi:hypothetical protein
MLDVISDVNYIRIVNYNITTKTANCNQIKHRGFEMLTKVFTIDKEATVLRINDRCLHLKLWCVKNGLEYKQVDFFLKRSKRKPKKMFLDGFQLDLVAALIKDDLYVGLPDGEVAVAMGSGGAGVRDEA